MPLGDLGVLGVHLSSQLWAQILTDMCISIMKAVVVIIITIIIIIIIITGLGLLLISIPIRGLLIDQENFTALSSKGYIALNPKEGKVGFETLIPRLLYPE